MTSGAEAFKAAIRRSRLLIVLLVLLQVVAINVLKQLAGPRYDAKARVLISTQPFAQVISGTITGTTPVFVDPNRIVADARVLARSGTVFERAALETRFARRELEDATTVSTGTGDDLLTFTASSDEPNRAMRIANAVAKAYVDYRGALNNGDIANQIDRLRMKLAGLKPDDAARRGLEAKLTKLTAISSASFSDARLVQRAISAKQTTPAPLKDSLLGLAIGLVVALLVVAIREAVDTTVRSENDVEDVLSSPVLATLPRLPRQTRVVTYGRYEPLFADPYALLAASVAQARGTKQHTVVAVTSAVMDEGKTTTAVNLAVSLARRGTSVILGDFDFHKPALAEVFRVPENAVGVRQILAGSASVDDALWSVGLTGQWPQISPNGSQALGSTAAETGRDTAPDASLRLLVAGGTAKSSLVHGPAVARLVAYLQSRADFVVLDTPPALLTVEMAELSQLIDEVLIVVRQGRVTHRSLRALSRQARSWSAELVGAVLTDARDEGYRYAYHRGR
jgi:Mrp family chromosome partitioning ATPase